MTDLIRLGGEEKGMSCRYRSSIWNNTSSSANYERRLYVGDKFNKVFENFWILARVSMVFDEFESNTHPVY
jgi:hypothetical protein